MIKDFSKYYFGIIILFTVLISCSSIGNLSNNNINPCECEENLPEKKCHAKYKPVCGCDSITYDNACFARKNGIKNWTKGACK